MVLKILSGEIGRIWKSGKNFWGVLKTFAVLGLQISTICDRMVVFCGGEPVSFGRVSCEKDNGRWNNEKELGVLALRDGECCDAV